jgi:hypothetical protein
MTFEPPGIDTSPLRKFFLADTKRFPQKPEVGHAPGLALKRFALKTDLH